MDYNSNINWCWPKGRFISPPCAIFFEASCNRHDNSYLLWWDENDRLRADLWFRNAMFRDCQKKVWIVRIYYIIWSEMYFIAVRLFWKKYFNYKKNLVWIDL